MAALTEPPYLRKGITMKTALEIRDIESLELRFPYMFAGPVISLEFYRGWFPFFVKLCFVIDELLGDERHRFSWVRLTEKFGGYRMSFSFQLPPSATGGGDKADRTLTDDDQCSEEREVLMELRDQIRSAIKRCAALLDTRCCVCGGPGSKRTGGWIRTLCEFHTEDAILARGDARHVLELAVVPRWPGDIRGAR